jgi:hypothetical protein
MKNWFDDDDDDESWWGSIKFNLQCYCSRFKTIYYNVRWAIRNIWYFKQALYNYRSYDSHCSLGLFAVALEDLANDLKNDKWHLYAEKYYKQTKEVAEIIKRVSIEGDHPVYDKLYVKYSDKHWSYFKRVKSKRGVTWTFPDAPEHLMKRVMKYNKLNEEFKKEQLFYALNRFLRRYRQWWS